MVCFDCACRHWLMWVSFLCMLNFLLTSHSTFPTKNGMISWFSISMVNWIAGFWVFKWERNCSRFFWPMVQYTKVLFMNNNQIFILWQAIASTYVSSLAMKMLQRIENNGKPLPYNLFACRCPSQTGWLFMTQNSVKFRTCSLLRSVSCC